MEFLRLTSPDDVRFAPAFALYRASFPPHEQRNEGAQRALLGNPAYHFCLVAEGGGVAGILLYWQFAGYVYVEHFAIDPAQRGRALGSVAMQAFCGQHPLVVLEIDPPLDEVSRRRQGFYERLGFAVNPYTHRHPPYRRGCDAHELAVLSCPRALAEGEYAGFARDLRKIVMADGPAGE